MPAECGRVPLTHRLWSGSEAKVKNINMRCGVAVIGLSGGIPAKFNLFWLIIFDFEPFNVVKEVQIFESKDSNLVSFALCFFQLLLS